MFDSKMLDVLIGLVLMMAVVSMAASTIVEAYSGIVKKRGQELERALNRTLWSVEGTARQIAAGIASTEAEARVLATEQTLERARGQNKGVNAAETAHNAAVEAAATALAAKAAADQADADKNPISIGTTEVVQSLKTTPALWLTRKLPGIGKERFPSYLSPAAFVDAVAEIVRSPDFPHPDKLDKRIAAAADLVGDTAEDVATAVRSHFDEVTQRLSGMYKRWSTFWLFLAGLAIALIGNVSIFRAADSLWSDGATRDAVVASAGQVNDNGGAAGLDPAELRSVSDTVSELQSEGFPVGWTAEAKAEWGWDFTLARVGVFTGWLVTAFLVTLGAPFWFDLLSKLIALRSAGKPKETKEDKTPSAGAPPGGEGPDSEPKPTLAETAKAQGESEVLRLAFK